MNNTQKTILKRNEAIEKTQYNEGECEIENASFTPLFFQNNGATGEEATRFHIVLAEKMVFFNFGHKNLLCFFRISPSASLIIGILWFMCSHGHWRVLYIVLTMFLLPLQSIFSVVFCYNVTKFPVCISE